MADAKHHLSSGVRQLYADPAGAAAQAVDKIAAARVWLLKEKPFFGVLARALQVEPTLSVTAFRLTGDNRLLCNALVTLELKFPALCARLAHLALHAALGGLVRRGARDPLRWNAAHDLAIDPLLRAAGFTLGPGLVLGHAGGDHGALAETLGGMPTMAAGASAEQAYVLLPEGTRPDDAWCDISDPPPPPDAAIAGTYTRQDDGLGDDPGSGGGADDDGPGDKPRSGAGDDADEGDPEPGERDRSGGDDRPADSSIEARGRELQWRIRLGAALEEERASGGKTFGEIPAWLDDLVRATIEPPPDWSATLQRSVAMLTRSDRSFLRPSRRMSALVGPDGAWPDVVAMPGRRVEPAGRLVAVVDTSASIDERVLARFLGALASVASAEGVDEIRLIQADAEVTRDETVFAAELYFAEIAIVGRGGTDFGPALRRLAEESRREVERFTVVYLTDLDGRFPEPADAAPLEVLWVVPGKVAKRPPFGRLLEMGPERAR